MNKKVTDVRVEYYDGEGSLKDDREVMASGTVDELLEECKRGIAGYTRESGTECCLKFTCEDEEVYVTLHNCTSDKPVEWVMVNSSDYIFLASVEDCTDYVVDFQEKKLRCECDALCPKDYVESRRKEAAAE